MRILKSIRMYAWKDHSLHTLLYILGNDLTQHADAKELLPINNLLGDALGTVAPGIISMRFFNAVTPPTP